MNDVLVHDQAEVAADGARGSLGRVGCPHKGAALGNSALAGDDHLHNRAGGDVGDQTLVEGLALMLGVIGLRLLGGDHAKLHALDGEAGALEAIDDLADMSVTHAIGLDHGVGLLDCHCFPFNLFKLSIHERCSSICFGKVERTAR